VISAGLTVVVKSFVAAGVTVVGDDGVDGDADGLADGLVVGDADGLGDAEGEALGDGEAAMTTVAPRRSAATAATPANLRMVLSFRSCPARCEASLTHRRAGCLNPR
jgi:hypothetical protein